jgi:hypothetical protein
MSTRNETFQVLNEPFDSISFNDAFYESIDFAAVPAGLATGIRHGAKTMVRIFSLSWPSTAENVDRRSVIPGLQLVLAALCTGVFLLAIHPVFADAMTQFGQKSLNFLINGWPLILIFVLALIPAVLLTGIRR